MEAITKLNWKVKGGNRDLKRDLIKQGIKKEILVN